MVISAIADKIKASKKRMNQNMRPNDSMPHESEPEFFLQEDIWPNEMPPISQEMQWTQTASTAQKPKRKLPREGVRVTHATPPAIPSAKKAKPRKRLPDGTDPRNALIWGEIFRRRF